METGTAYRELRPLVLESRTIQEEMDRFRVRYERRSGAAPLAPVELHEIREGVQRYLTLQQRLAGVVDRAEPEAAKGDATALAASVTLYDNYLAMLPLFAHRHFRRLVNYPDLGYGISRNELWNLIERLNDPERRTHLRRLASTWETTGADPVPWDETIRTTATWHLVKDGTLDRKLPTTFRVRRERILDGIATLGETALYAVSEGFGNAIGTVELRKGKLWQREDVLAHLHRVLRPLDLLLEKTPFRLTDLFIPGHFGHVAIWMGRPQRLKRLGVWEHPDMQEARLQACRHELEDGKGVLEALRPGVELNPLRVFANVDDLAILRPRRMRRAEQIASLVRGFQQVGKRYDFNFDVETTDTIVCSELPYHVYPDVEWGTAEQLGRFTISPDHVALQAVGGNADFRLVAFYHDGALVPPKESMATFKSLLAS